MINSKENSQSVFILVDGGTTTPEYLLSLCTTSIEDIPQLLIDTYKNHLEVGEAEVKDLKFNKNQKTIKFEAHYADGEIHQETLRILEIPCIVT